MHSLECTPTDTISAANETLTLKSKGRLIQGAMHHVLLSFARSEQGIFFFPLKDTLLGLPEFLNSVKFSLHYHRKKECFFSIF